MHYHSKSRQNINYNTDIISMCSLIFYVELSMFKLSTS